MSRASCVRTQRRQPHSTPHNPARVSPEAGRAALRRGLGTQLLRKPGGKPPWNERVVAGLDGHKTVGDDPLRLSRPPTCRGRRALPPRRGPASRQRAALSTSSPRSRARPGRLRCSTAIPQLRQAPSPSILTPWQCRLNRDVPPDVRVCRGARRRSRCRDHHPRVRVRDDLRTRREPVVASGCGHLPAAGRDEHAAIDPQAYWGRGRAGGGLHREQRPSRWLALRTVEKETPNPGPSCRIVRWVRQCAATSAPARPAAAITAPLQAVGTSPLPHPLQQAYKLRDLRSGERLAPLPLGPQDPRRPPEVTDHGLGQHPLKPMSLRSTVRWAPGSPTANSSPPNGPTAAIATSRTHATTPTAWSGRHRSRTRALRSRLHRVMVHLSCFLSPR